MVHKLTTVAKAAVGQACRGGSTSGRRGGGRRGGFNNYSGGSRQQYNRQNDYNYDFRPADHAVLDASMEANNGGGRGNGGGTCFILGSTWHQAK
jgi:hypothetical protein